MPVFEEFPYTNFHELNLDWILKEMKELRSDFAEFVGGHVITYADPIQWDITRTYPAYCIVLDSAGNAYMSVQEVPGGIALTDTAYWMSIGNFYAAVPQILEDEGIQPQIRIKRHFRYYIDGVNGSDDNDGLSSSQAFKTLNRFLSLSNKYTEARAYIITAGTYIANDCSNITGFSFHLWATVPGVTVLFTGDGTHQVSMYNCHLNIRGVDSDNPITIGVYPSYADNLLYFDNTNMSFAFARFNCKIAFWTCGAGLSNTAFPSLSAHNSNLIFTNGTNILNTENNVIAMEIHSSHIVLFGNFTNTNLLTAGTDNTSNVLYARGSVLFIGSVLAQALTNPYYYALNITNCMVLCSTARLTAMAGNAVAGNTIVQSYLMEPTDY